MAGALIIPGVQVRTLFEPVPALPGATGILGVIGVTDRGPLDPTPIGSFAELIEIFGPATRHTVPEVRTALANGVAQAVIARTAPGRGRKASVDLIDADGEGVLRLEARAEGAWGNRLAVKVIEVLTLGGGVKYVNLEVSYKDEIIERFENLITDPTSPNYIFFKVNAQSSVVVAIDPVFEKGLPEDLAPTALADSEARAATAVLRAGTEDVVTASAKRPGRAGNRTSVRVRDGRAGLALLGSGDAPSVDVQAREAGAGGAGIRVAVGAAAGGAVNVIVTPPAGTPRTYGPATNVAEIVAAVASDPDVAAVARGSALPSLFPSTLLLRRIAIEVMPEGQDVATHEDLGSLSAIAAVSDPQVKFEAVPGGTALPDANDGIPLQGGRGKGAALLVSGDAPDRPLVELVPAEGASGSITVRLTRGVSTLDNATPVVNLQIFVDDELMETFTNLTMDPDDPNYLPAMLEASGLLRAYDLFVRGRTTALPRALTRSVPLAQGVSPTADDYQGALERLESAEEVDLVLASVNDQLEDAAIRTVHQAVAAHCAKMAPLARNRIGIGSVTRSESRSVADILDHANDVRSDQFVLVAPAGTEAALAGLLGRQDYFDTPTFKTIASPGAPPGQYTDAQLTLLVSGNVLVINKRRKRGIIVIKGILTSGRQINVQRTADKAVRDINALANNYVGLLNNEGNRNALRQQTFALLAQMERDGALVPSTDGADPAFKVNVFATQDDFAKGIVRIDAALRPVRAIDYIYVTIFVQN